MKCYFMQRTKCDKNGDYKIYPCGHCAACRKNDATSWGLRSYFEARQFSSSSFLTLTYEDDCLLPSTLPDFAGNLSKSHIKDFTKKFAYYHKSPYRYFIGAEYGDTTNRPHYHCILFGVDITSPAFYDKEWIQTKNGYNCMCKAWTKGLCFLRPLASSDCFYSSKYSTKFTENDLKRISSAGMQPPFRVMSRMPGLGYNYFKEHQEEILGRGYIRFKGHKFRVPRYYYDKALPVGSQEREDYSYNRRVFYKNFSDKEYKQYEQYVGKGKQYSSWYYLNNALGEQQEINFRKGG